MYFLQLIFTYYIFGIIKYVERIWRTCVNRYMPFWYMFLLVKPIVQKLSTIVAIKKKIMFLLVKLNVQTLSTIVTKSINIYMLFCNMFLVEKLLYKHFPQFLQQVKIDICSFVICFYYSNTFHSFYNKDMLLFKT